jgi:hypothetical protein
MKSKATVPGSKGLSISVSGDAVAGIVSGVRLGDCV